jgi:hypothetical protein
MVRAVGKEEMFFEPEQILNTKVPTKQKLSEKNLSMISTKNRVEGGYHPTVPTKSIN